MRRPRVALVVHDIAPFGGMDRALRELIERASDRFDFVVLSRTLADDLRDLVEWRRVPVPARPIPLKFAAFFALAGLRLARENADLICGVGAIVPNRVDVALVHYCHTGFKRAIGGLAPADGSLPRRLNTRLLRGLSIAAERWCYRSTRVRELVAVSRGLASELQADIPGVPVSVIPNGVDRECFLPDPAVREEVRSELDIPKEAVVALFVGGDWERKGVAVAIEAVSRTAVGGATQLHLLVVGRGDEGRYATAVRSAGIEERVRFIGPRVDAGRFYQASDLFVFPTLYEALPLVALEAIAAGLPLVATRVNGVAELFADEEPGILVERNPDSVGEALLRLASDAELRRRLGEIGHRIVGAYTWERSVEATVELFRRALAEKEMRSSGSTPAGAPS